MRRLRLVAALCAVTISASARAADLGDVPHHQRHHHRVVREAAQVFVPQGYGYGGYGPGPGPGWVEGTGPGFGPGYAPGWGYIPAGAAPTILDLGY